MTENRCGTCTACCRVFAIAEMPEKKAGQWCQHCAVGKGCKVYDERPPTCVEFECLWLLSQKRSDPRERLSPELRPDRSKVVFSPSTDDTIMAATLMPNAPAAHHRRDVQALIGTMVRGGMRVVVGTPAATTRMMFDQQGNHEVYMTEPDEDGMQWNIPNPEGATQ
jgi:hypothetical protein